MAKKRSKTTFDSFMKDDKQKNLFNREYSKFLLSEFILEAMVEKVNIDDAFARTVGMRVVELSPGYAEAIEYRAETYLGLGRLDDAKRAYLTLFAGGSDRAGELLVAMREWLDEGDRDSVDIGVLFCALEVEKGSAEEDDGAAV